MAEQSGRTQTNVVTLIGNLVNDPRLLTHEQDGSAQPYCRFRLASSTRGGPCYIDVVVWNGQASVCAEHLSKGRAVAVTGELRSRTQTYDDYTNADGEPLTVTRHGIRAHSVEFLSGRGGAPEPLLKEKDERIELLTAQNQRLEARLDKLLSLLGAAGSNGSTHDADDDAEEAADLIQQAAAQFGITDEA